MAAINDSLCALCRVAQPAFICFCVETLLCTKCISQHILAWPGMDHKPIPISAANVLESQYATSHPATGTPSPAQWKLHLKHTLQSEQNRLQDFVSNALFQLQCARRGWQEQIARICDEHALAIGEKAEQLGKEIQQCLLDLENVDLKPWMETPIYKRLEKLRRDEELLKLSFSIHHFDLIPLFKQAVSYVITYDSQSGSPTLLYKLFGDTNLVGVFDVRTETYSKQIVASAKFLHNSCWTLVDDGDLLITGGSHTGKSHNDVLLLQPISGSVTMHEPMQRARRSHCAVWHSSLCFVFGGIMEQQSLSSCEAYSIRERRWRFLPQMKERRAYLGCSAHRQLIVIAGGGETSSLEIFDTERLEFQLVPAPHFDLLDNVSIMTLDDYVLIFHGNFQGRVSRYHPESGALEPLHYLCYGNSWSSTQPLVFKDCIYLLRSESVFRYDLASGVSAYLTRLARAFKCVD